MPEFPDPMLPAPVLPAPVLTDDELCVPVAPFVIHYALRLVRATRIHEGDVPAFVKDWVSWGAGPRGMQYLLLGGKARAMLNGRFFVTTDDERAVAHPVLRHRVITNFNAE